MSPLLLDPRLHECRRIFLHELEVTASIGFHDFEREAPQRVRISVEIFVLVVETTSGRDDVRDTLDYDRVREGIQQLATARHFNLQETLIDQVAEFCLDFAGVRAAAVRSDKPDVYPDCATVGIEVLRFASGRARG